MPFTQRNVKFTIIIIGMVVIGLGTVAALVVLITSNHSRDSILVTGFVGTILLVLGQLARAEAERTESKAERQEVKEVADQTARTAANASNKVHEVAVKMEQVVQAAEKLPSPAQQQMPQTPAELHDLLAGFSREICDTIAKTAAQEAALCVTRDFQDMIRHEIRMAAAEAGATKPLPPAASGGGG